MTDHISDTGKMVTDIPDLIKSLRRAAPAQPVAIGRYMRNAADALEAAGKRIKWLEDGTAAQREHVAEQDATIARLTAEVEQWKNAYRGLTLPPGGTQDESIPVMAARIAELEKVRACFTFSHPTGVWHVSNGGCVPLDLNQALDRCAALTPAAGEEVEDG